jgi:hypothetical protein
VDDPKDADRSSKNRRLLNTEKIIFKAEGSSPVSVDQSSTNELYLLLACRISMACLGVVILDSCMSLISGLCSCHCGAGGCGGQAKCAGESTRAF